ncbi:MAG TPA: hypothetical protein VIT92_04500, partial [Burkholderiaceae bacterium]
MEELWKRGGADPAWPSVKIPPTPAAPAAQLRFDDFMFSFFKKKLGFGTSEPETKPAPPAA